jgi:hypothetical protein
MYLIIFITSPILNWYYTSKDRNNLQPAINDKPLSLPWENPYPLQG